MEKMTPAQAVEILRKQGLDVTLEEAKLIVDFIYEMAAIAVAQVLREEASKSAEQG